MENRSTPPEEEKYEFTWVGKRSAAAEAGRPTDKRLRPCPEESESWDLTENIYIEGDNLDALKLLKENFEKKIDLVYTDPPYNTGRDFIYQDSFTAGPRGARSHSAWCSMMYSRLLLARELLSEEGAILINMDENEIANLQKLCEEVFGEANGLGMMIWDKRNPKGDARGISCQHEYILAYAKNRPLFNRKRPLLRPKRNAAAILKKAERLFARISLTYTLEDANSDFAAWMRTQKDFSGGERAYNRIDEQGRVFRPVSMAWPNRKRPPEDYFVPLIHPVTGRPCPVPERGWRNPSATMRRMLDEGLILFGRDERTIPNSKYFLSDNLWERLPSLLYYGGSDRAMLDRMGIPFDTPKAVNVCAGHIRAFAPEDCTVLDFFSGSATVAHAVMRLNAEDGGRRKFIMVQLPEPIPENSQARRAGFSTISELGMERIRRSREETASRFPGAVFDGGFRLFRIEDSED